MHESDVRRKETKRQMDEECGRESVRRRLDSRDDWKTGGEAWSKVGTDDDDLTVDQCFVCIAYCCCCYCFHKNKKQNVN